MAPLPALAAGVLNLSTSKSVLFQQSNSTTKAVLPYLTNATDGTALLMSNSQSNSNAQALLFNILMVMLGFAAVILSYLQLRRFVNERFGMDILRLDSGLVR